jgi:hypothetical protein
MRYVSSRGLCSSERLGMTWYGCRLEKSSRDSIRGKGKVVAAAVSVDAFAAQRCSGGTSCGRRNWGCTGRLWRLSLSAEEIANRHSHSFARCQCVAVAFGLQVAVHEAAEEALGLDATTGTAVTAEGAPQCVEPSRPRRPRPPPLVALRRLHQRPRRPLRLPRRLDAFFDAIQRDDERSIRHGEGKVVITQKATRSQDGRQFESQRLILYVD